MATAAVSPPFGCTAELIRVAAGAGRMLAFFDYAQDKLAGGRRRDPSSYLPDSSDVNRAYNVYV